GFGRWYAEKGLRNAVQASAVNVAAAGGGAAFALATGNDPLQGAQTALSFANLFQASRELMKRGCFAAGTPLRTPEGHKAIEEFREGDLLLSRSDADPDGPVAAKRVEEVFVRTGRLLHLQVGGRVIRTTAEHPFWVGERGWRPASELRVGELLTSDDGQWVAVEDLLDTGEDETGYNLRVQ